MKPPYTQEQIDEMRKRLYDREVSPEGSTRHELTDTKIDVSRDWGTAQRNKPNTTDLRSSLSSVDDESTTIVSAAEPPKRHYRSFVLIGSLLIFIFVAGISSLYLYFGGNQISSDNIQITLQGPTSHGGGEIASLQIAVTNQNTTPIESAMLVIKYPPGTMSIGDSPRSLFEERIPIDSIAAGEVRNIPIQVAIFGEENSEKKVEASVEYRIGGSSGTFVKEAEPLSMQITSSPLVIRVENIEKVASGQLVDITLTAVSNASSPLNDILVSASYPNGFEFESSDPSPVSGQNVWRIDQLLPEQTTTIKIQGIVRGLTDESFRINFIAGPASSNNQYSVGSTLLETRADFTIERPFIDVAVAINGDESRQVVIPQAAPSTVAVDITNTLSETVYDMVVEVVPEGNALTNNSIRGRDGFYDSNTGTVRWEVANNPSFERVLPGDVRTLSFDVTPGPNRASASYELVVNVYARRVAESSALETLIGSSRAEAKYSSSVTLGSQAGRSNDIGPIPPEVGEVTSYTITLVAEAGANNMENAIVETDFPLYVNWLDEYEVEGTINYNSVLKRLQWIIGDIPANTQKELSFKVNILPSTSQIKTRPILVNSQRLKANDQFTGALLQDTAQAVTTELSAEMGFEEGNGIIQP